MAHDEQIRGGWPASDELGRLAYNSPDPLMMLDIEGCILAVNPAWDAVLGWRPDELLGRRFFAFIHPDDREHTLNRWETVIAGRTVVDERNRWPTSDGDWRWLSWSWKYDPATRHVFSAGRDVTRRMEGFLRIADDRELLAAAERLANVGSWEWDLSEDVVTVSEQMRVLMGLLDGDPLTSRRLFQLIHPDDRPRVEALLESAIRLREVVGAEFRLAGSAELVGTERVMSARAEPELEDGSATVTRLFGAVQDVTEQRHLDRLKEAFLAAVSHEMRTPLTVVEGIASSLVRLRGVDEPRRPMLEDALVRNVERLSRLLSDLLDLGRLERGQLRVQRSSFDVASLVRRVASASAIPRRITVEGPGSLTITADQLMVERILTNLLDNAAKYAPEGPVTVTFGDHLQGGLLLSVTDEGPGVAAADRDVIFQPFHRVSDENPQPGTGVGLALVREFARAHDGHARVEGGDIGATFVIELPPFHGSEEGHDDVPDDLHDDMPHTGA